jgi:DNA-binding MarR family transcriptional regulator
MLALWSHPQDSAQPPSVKAIAAMLQMDSATLSPMLKRLEAVGLITRSRSAADERTIQIGLTDKGVRLRREALTIPPAVVERLGVDMDELEHLHAVLTRINCAALAAGALDTELDR